MRILAEATEDESPGVLSWLSLAGSTVHKLKLAGSHSEEVYVSLDRETLLARTEIADVGSSDVRVQYTGSSMDVDVEFLGLLLNLDVVFDIHTDEWLVLVSDSVLDMPASDESRELDGRREACFEDDSEMSDDECLVDCSSPRVVRSRVAELGRDVGCICVDVLVASLVVGL